MDVRREVGEREACDLVGLLFFTRSSRELPNPLVLTGLEKTLKWGSLAPDGIPRLVSKSGVHSTSVQEPVKESGSTSPRIPRGTQKNIGE